MFREPEILQQLLERRKSESGRVLREIKHINRQKNSTPIKEKPPDWVKYENISIVLNCLKRNV